MPAYFQYKKSATSPPKEIRSSKMPASVQMKDHLLNCPSLPTDAGIFSVPPRQNRRFSTEFNFSPEPMFFLTVELVLNLKLNFFLSILEPFLPSSWQFGLAADFIQLASDTKWVNFGQPCLSDLLNLSEKRQLQLKLRNKEAIGKHLFKLPEVLKNEPHKTST